MEHQSKHYGVSARLGKKRLTWWAKRLIWRPKLVSVAKARLGGQTRNTGQSVPVAKARTMVAKARTLVAKAPTSGQSSYQRPKLVLWWQNARTCSYLVAKCSYLLVLGGKSASTLVFEYFSNKSFPIGPVEPSIVG